MTRPPNDPGSGSFEELAMRLRGYYAALAQTQETAERLAAMFADLQVRRTLLEDQQAALQRKVQATYDDCVKALLDLAVHEASDQVWLLERLLELQVQVRGMSVQAAERLLVATKPILGWPKNTPVLLYGFAHDGDGWRGGVLERSPFLAMTGRRQKQLAVQIIAVGSPRNGSLLRPRVWLDHEVKSPDSLAARKIFLGPEAIEAVICQEFKKDQSSYEDIRQALLSAGMDPGICDRLLRG